MTVKPSYIRAAESLKARGVKASMGIAWFDAESYPRLMAIAADADNRPPTYAEFEQRISAKIGRLIAAGHQVEKVIVDKLMAFCRMRGVPVNIQSVALFVAALLAVETERRERDH